MSARVPRFRKQVIMPMKQNHSGRSLFALLILTVLLAGSVMAQVPTMMSYQSRVLMNNTNFNGAGQFKFAFVNGAGNVTFWSNDGTSVAGSQPTASVSLTVANGLVMTLLGDSSLPNMTAIPATVFNNADVRLRVWFNGGAGFQLLTPDQRIVSVGYALMAHSVPDGSISTPKLAAGVLNPTNFPANSVTSVQVADTIALGQTNINGRLDVYRTGANTPAITLDGGNNTVNVIGDLGSELARIWGQIYGEVLLKDSAGFQNAVQLSANANSGGYLSLNNSNGVARAYLSGANTGGSLTLNQADGGSGVLLDGDSGTGYGALSLRSTNGSTRVTLAGGPSAGQLTLNQSDGNTGAVLYGNDAGTGGGALSLRKADGNAGVRAFGGSLAGSIDLINRLNNVSLSLWNYDNEEGTVSVRNSAGAETIYLWGRDSSGAGHGQIGLKKSDGIQTIYMQASEGGNGGQIVLNNGAGTISTVQIDGEVGAGGGGYIGLRNGSGTENIVLNADDGTVTGQVIEITGGSDLSENFDITGETNDPGMIVSIDPANPGKLVPSASPYDKKVAGVISGAGGVRPGMLMGQRGSVADGKHPVALTGRVYCHVDADANGAIEPGDMLTTSITPGHGMKATDPGRATGAIIGKAMTSLAKGKGLVLVLVNLQ